jgi:hypothetical protein
MIAVFVPPDNKIRWWGGLAGTPRCGVPTSALSSSLRMLSQKTGGGREESAAGDIVARCPCLIKSRHDVKSSFTAAPGVVYLPGEAEG